CWVALLVALAVAGPGAAWVSRLPDQYRASSQILIEPPRFDAGVVAVLPHGAGGAFDRDSNERYVPNKNAQLKSRSLAEEVAAQATAQPYVSGLADPAGEISAKVQARQIPGTTIFDVSLEQTD